MSLPLSRRSAVQMIAAAPLFSACGAQGIAHGAHSAGVPNATDPMQLIQRIMDLDSRDLPLIAAGQHPLLQYIGSDPVWNEFLSAISTLVRRKEILLDASYAKERGLSSQSSASSDKERGAEDAALQLLLELSQRRMWMKRLMQLAYGESVETIYTKDPAAERFRSASSTTDCSAARKRALENCSA